MNQYLCHNQSIISKPAIDHARSLKTLETYTLDRMAKDYAKVIKEKMEVSSSIDPRNNDMIVNTKVAILSPEELREMIVEIEHLKIQVSNLKQEVILAKSPAFEPLTYGQPYNREQENRAKWGIFG